MKRVYDGENVALFGRLRHAFGRHFEPPNAGLSNFFKARNSHIP